MHSDYILIILVVWLVVHVDYILICNYTSNMREITSIYYNLNYLFNYNCSRLIQVI